MEKEKRFTSARDVANAWAQQSHEGGWCGRSRDKKQIFFDGPIVYSYGTHYALAQLVHERGKEKVCLVNPQYYSRTTRTHSKECARAARAAGVPLVYADPLVYRGGTFYEYRLNNIFNAETLGIEKSAQKLRRSRKLSELYTDELFGKVENLTRLLSYFDQDDKLSELDTLLASLASADHRIIGRLSAGALALLAVENPELAASWHVL